jgi:hypothetical protein
MRSLWDSIKALSRGIVSKFLLWLPFILLDATDYWEKYIQRWIRSLTGRDLNMPESALPIMAVAGVTWAAIWTYHELRQEKMKQDEELSPSVVIDPTPSLRQWFMGGKPCRCFYVTIRNPSAKALHNVCVYLTDISPRVPDLDWLPIPLHIKHDNQTPHHEYFHMNPRGIRHVDLVSHQFAQSTLTIEHIVPGVNKYAPVGTYIFTLRVEGSSIASPSTAKFMVKLDHLGNVICLPATYVDLDKGLLEFHHDAYDSLAPFTETLTKQASLIQRVGEVATSLNVQLSKAQATPISAVERLIGIKNATDRARRTSPRWARKIDRVSADLEESVDRYTLAASAVIDNFTGYAELATTVKQADLQGFRNLHAAVAETIINIKVLRTRVLENQNLRMLTHLTRSMRRLGAVVDRQIEITEKIAVALGDVISLAEAKSPTDEIDKQ